jgi:hypothetical protein
VKVNAREKKILYGGVVVAAAILIYYAVTEFSPGDGESLAEQVEMQKSLLSRQRDLIEREEFFKNRVEEAENDIEKIQDRLLPGNNAGTAGTELQRILRDFTDRSGVVILTMSNMPERRVADSDSLIKISVRLGVNCQLEDLVEFLITIKNYDKFLKVEELTVNTTTVQRKIQMRNSLTMVVAGYISVPPAEPAAKSGDPGQTTTSAAIKRR